MSASAPHTLPGRIVDALCIVAVIGAGAYSLFAPPIYEPALESASGGRTQIEGVVVRDPDMRESSVRITVLPDRVAGERIAAPHARVIVSADRFTGVSYGDRIQATGTLRSPEPFATDSGRTFDYPKYLLAHKVTHTMSFANVSVLARGEGNHVVAFLLSVKHALLAGIERALPEPEGALLAGLLLGEKQSLGDRIMEAFRASGVVHIIVLSGYNVALVINSVTYIATRILPRLAAYGVAAVFVLGFAVMTGASETTVRATIMALLMMTATVFRRPAIALRGLFIASAAMAIWNPMLVLYDLSYQLSVLATLGLILFSNRIETFIPLVPRTLALREIVATTLATQITVLPVLILSIGAVSLVFLPANALILPAVPLAMLAGFIAALVALVLPVLVLPFAALAYGLLWWIIAVALFFGELPSALVSIPEEFVPWTLAGLAVCYAILFYTFRRLFVPRLDKSRHN